MIIWLNLGGGGGGVHVFVNFCPCGTLCFQDGQKKRSTKMDKKCYENNILLLLFYTDNSCLSVISNCNIQSIRFFTPMQDMKWRHVLLTLITINDILRNTLL